MLVDLGCSWVIVGHSERRGALGDTHNVIAAKVRAALEAGLKPILCVGETLAQREAGEAEIVVRSQLDGVILSLGSEGVGISRSRLQASMGHWHRQDCYAGRSGSDACIHTVLSRAMWYAGSPDESLVWGECWGCKRNGAIWYAKYRQ